MQAIQTKFSAVIPTPESVSFKNGLGAIEKGKLTFYPIQKTYLIDTIATIDQIHYKDTRYNIALFVVSFFLMWFSFFDLFSSYSLLFRFFGALCFFGMMFFKKERYVLTIIFIHRKAVSFSVTKQQYHLSWQLLHSVGLYQIAYSRFNKSS